MNENGNNAAGNYTLTYVVVSDSPSSCAAPIACGTTVATSFVTPTESDTYAYTAASGDIVGITSSETAAGLNACWELYNPAGTRSRAHACSER